MKNKTDEEKKVREAIEDLEIIKLEILGSSDGAANQSFSLSKNPEDIWVQEPSILDKEVARRKRRQLTLQLREKSG